MLGLIKMLLELEVAEFNVLMNQNCFMLSKSIITRPEH